MTPSFWRGRTVLITGHTGFKGSWLALLLHRLGARVTGFSLAPDSTPNLFEQARIGDSLDRSIIGDLRDAAAVERAVNETGAEVVFHLGAQALVRRSYREPIETYATNVMGTVHLLEALRRSGTAKAIVSVTSDKCYENREWIWPYRENEAMGGHDPYSSSKGCAELVTSAYNRSYFAAANVGLASARAGNVIGGGDWSEDRLLVDLVKGFAEGTPVLIRNPAAIRPWQHVLDALCGYILLAQKLHGEPATFAGGWNFGPSADTSADVATISDCMVARWGAPAKWVRDQSPGVHEAHYLRLDASKARAQLDWRPRLQLDEALDWIVDWYMACAAGEDMHARTLGQIDAFLVKDTMND